MKKRRIMVPIILLALACPVIPGFDSGLKVRCYTVESDAVQAPVRVALISDLHSCGYGENQRELIDAVDSQNPDLVLMTGDIFDDELPDDNTEQFLHGVGKRYPCYYVTGNHEHWSGSGAFLEKMDILKKCGVHRLSGVCETVSVRGTAINLCGVDDPEASFTASADSARDTVSFLQQIDQVRKASENGNYTILLSHRPEFFELYAAQGFDLALCGHAHGGQFRIPGILNGLYAPNQGFFPKYAGGDTGFGIPNVGKAAAKTIMKRFSSITDLEEADRETLMEVDDVGEVSADCIFRFFHDEKNRAMINRLKSLGVNMEAEETETIDSAVSGKTGAGRSASASGARPSMRMRL